MNLLEANDALRNMVVICDTREQDTPLLRARLAEIGCPIERAKLDAGDYGCKVPLPSGEWIYPPVAIERKMSLDEIANCFCQGRKRFEREFKRAMDAGTRVYLLVEGASWEAIYAGFYRSKMSAASFSASMLAFIARYNLVPVFCSPKSSGKLIHDILYREALKHLEGMCDE